MSEQISSVTVRGVKNNTVIISGASGLVGSALVESFKGSGFTVKTLVRREPWREGEIRWDPGVEPLDPEVLAQATAVINLNGASIGKLPWSKKYKEILFQSRVDSARTIADALLELGEGAPHLLAASAVGFYGDRPGEVLTEETNSGDTFLANLCVAWESESMRASAVSGVTLLRTAPILHAQGVLKPLMLLTKFGLSGPLGSGNQIWPWISLVDEVRAIRYLAEHKVYGPVNLCAPTVANANDIGHELARQMKRPFLLKAPAFALRMVLGKDAVDSLLLSDADVKPEVLQSHGFKFEHPTVQDAVSAAL